MSRTSAVVCSFVLLGAPLLAGRAIAPTSQPKAVTLRGYPKVGAPAVLRVLTAGTAPQRQLRYKVTPGSRTRISTTVDNTGSTLTFGGHAEPIPVVTKIVAEVLVTGVAADGDISHDVTFVDCKLEQSRSTPPLLDLLAAKGVAVTSDRGVARSMEWHAASNVGFYTYQVENLSVPFPEEPVGVGARWEVRQGLLARDLYFGSPTFFQRTEYELVSEEAGSVSVKFSIEQTAPSQTVLLFGSGPLYARKLVGAGAGTAIVHLNSHLPQRDQTGTTSLKGRLLIGEQDSEVIVVASHWRTRLSVAGGPEKRQ